MRRRGRVHALHETVTVITANGEEIKGVTLNEDSFTLQMMDTAEHLRLLEKDKLRSINKTRQSLMPIYNADLLSDKDLHDIIAYLISVGAQ